MRMPLDLFVFLALLPFVIGFLALERLDFGRQSKPAKPPNSFQPGKLTQKRTWFRSDQRKIKKGYQALTYLFTRGEK